jgi:serine/threonine-protein kinase
VSSTAYASPAPDLVLDRYRPLRPIGRGGSGSVWLARDERTGLEVALKIVPREGKRASRAAREMEAASRLRHERCVRAYDFGGDSGHVYIAYEYIHGHTLRELLRAGRLNDRDAIEAAAQVLDALAYAHRQGIVHRDVKPSNVLVEDTPKLSVRLLDFGLAQFDEADTLTAVGDVPGTLAYIAPERLTGGDATAASDVWAVGVPLGGARGPASFLGRAAAAVAAAIESGAKPIETVRRDLRAPCRRRLVGARGRSRERPSAERLAAALRAAQAPRAPRARTPERTAPKATVTTSLFRSSALSSPFCAGGRRRHVRRRPASVLAAVARAPARTRGGGCDAAGPRLGLAIALSPSSWPRRPPSPTPRSPWGGSPCAGATPRRAPVRRGAARVDRSARPPSPPSSRPAAGGGGSPLARGDRRRGRRGLRGVPLPLTVRSSRTSAWRIDADRDARQALSTVVADNAGLARCRARSARRPSHARRAVQGIVVLADPDRSRRGARARAAAAPGRARDARALRRAGSRLRKERPVPLDGMRPLPA